MRRLIRIMLKAATAVRRHCAALAEAPCAVSEKTRAAATLFEGDRDFAPAALSTNDGLERRETN